MFKIKVKKYIFYRLRTARCCHSHVRSDDLRLLPPGEAPQHRGGVAVNDTDLLMTLTPSPYSSCSSSRCVFFSSSRQPASELPPAHQAVTYRVCDYLNIFFNLPHLCSQQRSPLSQLQFLWAFALLMIQNHKPSVRRRRRRPWFFFFFSAKRQIKSGCGEIGRDAQLKKLLLWDRAGSGWDFASVTIPFRLKWSIWAAKRRGKGCLSVCVGGCVPHKMERDGAIQFVL